LDSNRDRINNAIIRLTWQEYYEVLVLIAYIKIGSSIVYEYDRRYDSHGVFYYNGIDAIVSIDGIPKEKLFPAW
jgi:hypothetical protein